jgi:hypothetical protein
MRTRMYSGVRRRGQAVPSYSIYGKYYVMQKLIDHSILNFVDEEIHADTTIENGNKINEKFFSSRRNFFPSPAFNTLKTQKS